VSPNLIQAERTLTARTGRWRTCWTVDKAAGEVNGTINVDVHYFEQGNVSCQAWWICKKLI